jgi:hypothetical protein
MMFFDQYFWVIASWAQKLPGAIKIRQGWRSVPEGEGVPMGTKNPLGDTRGVSGHQNMPMDSLLGPATSVIILAPIGANAFDFIAGQGDRQTDI